ncbi:MULTISPECIES: YdaU family protein [unclassified Acinetobacter]|uniref:YdaU family protein n=1 Tax=unclassified Acinetobacter TaxID=196816 RepID=UPI003AF7B8F4
MHYYKKNIGDYRGATSHLTLLEHGVYGWLLDTYYMDEKPLPLDERQLFRVALARTDEEKQAVRDVLNEFFVKTENGWLHNRCELEIKAFHAKAESNRKNGNKGGRPAKENPQQNPEETHSVNSGNPQKTLTINQEPLTINHEPITSNQYIYTLDLDYVNANLLKSGRKPVDQKYIDQLQPQFELYYANQPMVDNKALVKFVQWIMRNQDQPQKQQSITKTTAQILAEQRMQLDQQQGQVIDVGEPKKPLLIEEVGRA